MSQQTTARVMIGVNEIMQKMGIGRDNAYQLIKEDKFPVKKIGRRYLVHEDVFDQWLRGELKYNKFKK